MYGEGVFFSLSQVARSAFRLQHIHSFFNWMRTLISHDSRQTMTKEWKGDTMRVCLFKVPELERLGILAWRQDLSLNRKYVWAWNPWLNLGFYSPGLLLTSMFCMFPNNLIASSHLTFQRKSLPFFKVPLRRGICQERIWAWSIRSNVFISSTQNVRPCRFDYWRECFSQSNSSD